MPPHEGPPPEDSQVHPGPTGPLEAPTTLIQSTKEVGWALCAFQALILLVSGPGLGSILVLFGLFRAVKGIEVGERRSLRCLRFWSCCTVFSMLAILLLLVGNIFSGVHCACNSQCVNFVYDQVQEERAWYSAHGDQLDDMVRNATGKSPADMENFMRGRSSPRQLGEHTGAPHHPPAHPASVRDFLLFPFRNAVGGEREGEPECGRHEAGLHPPHHSKGKGHRHGHRDWKSSRPVSTHPMQGVEGEEDRAVYTAPVVPTPLAVEVQAPEQAPDGEGVSTSLLAVSHAHAPRRAEKNDLEGRLRHSAQHGTGGEREHEGGRRGGKQRNHGKHGKEEEEEEEGGNDRRYKSEDLQWSIEVASSWGNLTRGDMQERAARVCQKASWVPPVATLFLLLSALSGCVAVSRITALAAHPWVEQQEGLRRMWRAAQAQSKAAGAPLPPPPPGLLVPQSRGIMRRLGVGLGGVDLMPAPTPVQAPPMQPYGHAVPVSVAPSPTAPSPDTLYRFVPGVGFVSTAPSHAPSPPSVQAEQGGEREDSRQAPPQPTYAVRPPPAMPPMQPYPYAPYPYPGVPGQAYEPSYPLSSVVRSVGANVGAGMREMRASIAEQWARAGGRRGYGPVPVDGSDMDMSGGGMPTPGAAVQFVQHGHGASAPPQTAGSAAAYGTGLYRE